jgi:S1-C subfamily serine protease
VVARSAGPLPRTEIYNDTERLHFSQTRGPDDGASYTAKVIGADQKTDLALIKVDGKSDFPFVKFADRAPRHRN